MDEERRMLPVGAMLAGKYKVVRYLASGGFGNTYEAIDTVFDERVAIKELYLKGICGRKSDSLEVSVSISENRRDFAEHKEKFRKEAKRLRKLHNEHIVRVHDMFDEYSTTYYVMDYIDGESLSSRLKHQGHPFSEQQTEDILNQMLNALDTIHGEELWHLDIKPANIMMDKKGVASLIDFGASKRLYNEDGSTKPTSTAVSYTQGYAPREQMEGDVKKFGSYTDIFALGATLYNLLTGKTPPSSSDIDDLGTDAFQFPATASKKICDLIMAMMRTSRTKRLQNVQQVRDFIAGKISNTQQEPNNDDDTIRKKKPTPTPKPVPDPEPEPESTWNRKKIISICAAAVVAVVVLIVIFSSPSKPVEPTTTVTAVEDKTIVLTKGHESKRNFVYTGQVDAEGLPHGQGQAQYPETKSSCSCTFNGTFEHGITSEGEMTFSNKTKYNGTFTSEGYFKEGTWTEADGYYFSGSFKNGDPYNGTWYTPQGAEDSKVVNGQ